MLEAHTYTLMKTHSGILVFGITAQLVWQELEDFPDRRAVDWQPPLLEQQFGHSGNVPFQEVEALHPEPCIAQTVPLSAA